MTFNEIAVGSAAIGLLVLLWMVFSGHTHDDISHAKEDQLSTDFEKRKQDEDMRLAALDKEQLLEESNRPPGT